MKERFRQSMAWLHTWSGLLPGWVLYFIFLTGSVGYFDTEVDRWMRPELPMAPWVSVDDAVTRGLARLQQVAPNSRRWMITLPDRDNHPGAQIAWRNSSDAGQVITELLDGGGAEPIKPRQTGGGQLLYQMHWGLHYLPLRLAYWLVGGCAMLMLVALLSGIITHRRIFKEFFTFRPGKGQRSWLDAHNVLGVAALPFHIMITYSGLVFMMFTYMPLVLDESWTFDEQNLQLFFDEAIPRLEVSSTVAWAAPAGVAAPLIEMRSVLAVVAQHGKPLTISIRSPNDAHARIVVTYRANKLQSATQQMIFDGVPGALLEKQTPSSSVPRKVNEAMLGLHEGPFAGPLLRWLYFLSGLVSAAMIATGLVLWTAKRRVKRSASDAAFGVSVVEHLNAGNIVGLPIGIAAYFWANRLLPVHAEGRSQWEVQALFLTWLLILIYATYRPRRHMWFELCAIAAMAYGCLPLLNVVTTDRHLGITLPYDHWRGDWALAGVDLTMLTVGALFAAIAYRVRKHELMQLQLPTIGRQASLPMPLDVLE